MRGLSIFWMLALLLTTLGEAGAGEERLPRAFTQVRQELWDKGLWEDTQELEEDEKGILLGEDTQVARPEELERALAKASFLSNASR